MSRVMVLADLHGCSRILNNALQHAGEVDRVIIAGDLVDIGPDPNGVLDYAFSLPDEDVLFGNHDVAAMIGQIISPQDEVSFTFKDKLLDKVGKWKIATVVDDVIITHAGLCSTYSRLIDTYGKEGTVGVINESFEKEMVEWQLTKKFPSMAMDEYGPLWYRPYVGEVAPGLKQVAGHTPDMCYSPQMLVAMRKKGLRLIDTYVRGKFDEEGWYRYAIISDGKIRVHQGVLK
jgi:hypothetical protein